MEDSLTLKEQKLYCEQTLFQEQTEGGDLAKCSLGLD